MRGSGASVPRSTPSCPSSSSTSRTRSRSFTPRWSKTTATLMESTFPGARLGNRSAEMTEGMSDHELWQELGQQLRVDSIRCSASAKSGHPTSAMSAADLTAVLLAKYLRYDFSQPDDPNNDRLVFSKGHASTLLYALYKAGGAIDDEELMTYRQFGSRLEGHPTPILPWVDVATGSLGQGLPIGVGMA